MQNNRLTLLNNQMIQSSSVPATQVDQQINVSNLPQDQNKTSDHSMTAEQGNLQNSDISSQFPLTPEEIEFVNKYQIPLGVPKQQPISPSTTQDSPLILIRHTFSNQNLLEKKILEFRPNWKWNQAGEEDVELFTCEKNLDSLINGIGVQQALSQQHIVNQFNFKCVLVSPMRRTIQTCIYMFSSHPQRKDIQFILLPHLSECLCSSGCFSPYTLTTFRKEMEEIASKYEIKLNYSLVESLGETWQIQTLGDIPIKERMMKSLEDQKEKPYLKIVLEEIAKTKHFIIERFPSLYKRSLNTKEILKQEVEKLKADESADQNTKIGIVSHGFLLKCLTATYIDERGYPRGSRIMDNGQISPFNFTV